MMLPTRRGALPGMAKLGLLASLLMPTRAAAQSEVPGIRHVHWPLIDLVTLPDSTIGIWLLVAPSKGTVQWHGGASVVSLAVEPVLTLQWVMVGRKLLQDTGQAGRISMTPPLRSSCGPGFLLLARNPDKAPPEQAFILLVSDSLSRASWKTFASAGQIDSLLESVEQTAWDQEKWRPTSRSDSADTPVEIISQPTPRYPEKLTLSGREARVWTSYVVDSTGRPDRASFRVLLSDGQQFTEETIAALSRSKFKPASFRGRPVRQRVFQVISFRQR
jgi:Gram-negative bacterial TonB protein C-terminal